MHVCFFISHLIRSGKCVPGQTQNYPTFKKIVVLPVLKLKEGTEEMEGGDGRRRRTEEKDGGEGGKESIAANVGGDKDITLPRFNREVLVLYQPSLTEIRDTVMSFNLFIRDLGHEMSTFFLSPSTIFKLMYFNLKYFSKEKSEFLRLNANPNPNPDRNPNPNPNRIQNALVYISFCGARKKSDNRALGHD